LNQYRVSQRLLQNGLFLFLLGLFSGLAMVLLPSGFKNPRLALSGHLVGVTSGMFLAIIGLLVSRVQLAPRMLTAAFWLSLYGAYGNWAATILGGVFGTRALTSIAGAGHSGEPWQETLVGGMLTTSGTCTIAACVIFFWGLRPRGRPDGPPRGPGA